MIPFFSERKFYFREDIFLTTKLRPTDLGGTRCRYAVARFLEELGTNYLDLLLIHAPTVPAILSMAPTPYQQVLVSVDTFRFHEAVAPTPPSTKGEVTCRDVAMYARTAETRGPSLNRRFKLRCGSLTGSGQPRGSSASGNICLTKWDNKFF